jgi:hypothetical protein
VLLDEVLLCYLSHRQAPADPIEYARVLRAGNFIYMDEKGKVWLRGGDNFPPRQVPLLKNRGKIVTASLQTGAFASGDRLY